MEKQLPKYTDFISEVFAYASDPLQEDKKAAFVKKIKIDGKSVIQLVGHVDGMDKTHTAIISIRTVSLDNFGEDSLKQRIIIHQKDFSNFEDAENHLKETEGKINYIG